MSGTYTAQVLAPPDEADHQEAEMDQEDEIDRAKMAAKDAEDDDYQPSSSQTPYYFSSQVSQNSDNEGDEKSSGHTDGRPLNLHSTAVADDEYNDDPDYYTSDEEEEDDWSGKSGRCTSM